MAETGTRETQRSHHREPVHFLHHCLLFPAKWYILRLSNNTENLTSRLSLPHAIICYRVNVSMTIISYIQGWGSKGIKLWKSEYFVPTCSSVIWVVSLQLCFVSFSRLATFASACINKIIPSVSFLTTLDIIMAYFSELFLDLLQLLEANDILTNNKPSSFAFTCTSCSLFFCCNSSSRRLFMSLSWAWIFSSSLFCSYFLTWYRFENQATVLHKA